MKTIIHVTPDDRTQLARLIDDRNTPAKVVWRARIVLLTADGHSVNAIGRETGKSKPCVWRWQRRFAEDGVGGLLRDKTRPPGTPPLSQAVRLKVIAKTANERPLPAPRTGACARWRRRWGSRIPACNASGPRPA